MIIHFIKRDFVSHKFYWAVLGIATVGAVPCMFISEAFFMALFYAYVLFSLIPINSLTGVTWRSQHIMSRNYILALPVERNRLFLMIQYRALVYWIPLVILALAAPVIVPSFKDTVDCYPVYVLMIFPCIFWFINSMISMQLSGEKINSYLTHQKRLMEWGIIMAVFFIEVGIMLISVFGLLGVPFVCEYLGDAGSKVLPLIAVTGLAVNRFFSSKKRWLAQQ